MNKATLIMILFFTLLSCTSQEEIRVLGDEYQLLMVDDIKLYYGIEIPPSYQPQNPVPLVLALHYGGVFSDYYGKSFALNLVEPGLEELEAIIISPTCPMGDWNTPISEKAVMALIDHILSNYSIDQRRILVTGYSMGANGTWYFAAKYPDLFSIAIPISGTGMIQRREMLRVIKARLYVIHSRVDEICPFEEVEYLIDLLMGWGLPVEFRIVEDLSHYQTTKFIPYLQETVPWIQSIWDS